MLEMCFLYLKPECLAHKSCEYEVSRTIETNKDLNILYSGKMVITEELFRKQHPNLFVEEEGDTNEYGFRWKKDAIEKMVGFKVKIYLISCENCLNYCKEIKRSVRSVYSANFKKGCGIVNYIHAVDNQKELEDDVAIFLPKKLELVKRNSRTNR
jgi:Pyruvate/2-oxoacid:ferredoxin oxidoreductase delta subunit